MIENKYEIPYEPEDVISNGKNCTEALNKVFDKILSSTNVYKIQINGFDIQDGKQWRTFNIVVKRGSIVVNEEFRP